MHQKRIATPTKRNWILISFAEKGKLTNTQRASSMLAPFRKWARELVREVVRLQKGVCKERACKNNRNSGATQNYWHPPAPSFRNKKRKQKRIKNGLFDRMENGSQVFLVQKNSFRSKDKKWKGESQTQIFLAGPHLRCVLE